MSHSKYLALLSYIILIYEDEKVPEIWKVYISLIIEIIH